MPRVFPEMANNLLLLLGYCFCFFMLHLYTKPQEELGILCAVTWSVKLLSACLRRQLVESSSSGPSNGAAAGQGSGFRREVLSYNQGVCINHNLWDCPVGRHWLLSSTAGYWQPLQSLPLSGPEQELSAMCWLLLHNLVAPGDHLHMSTFRLFVCARWAVVSIVITSGEKKRKLLVQQNEAVRHCHTHCFWTESTGATWAPGFLRLCQSAWKCVCMKSSID